MFERGLKGYLVVNLVQAVAGLGSILIFTRLLPPAEYGDYALAYGATSLAYLMALTWIEAAMARFAAAAATAQDRADMLATLYMSFAAMMVLAPLAAVAVFLFAPLSSGLKGALTAGLASIVFRSLLRLTQERRRAEGDVGGFAAFDIAQTSGGFAVGALLCVVGFGAGAPLAGAGAASAVLLVFALPRELALARIGRFDPRRLAVYAAYGWPLSLSLMMSLALSTTDRFVIAADLNEAAVGVYHAGYTLSNRTLDVLFVWLGMAGQPACVAALERGGLPALRETAMKQVSAMILIALPAAVGLMLVARPLAEVLIGPALALRAASVTPWIAAGALLSGLTTHYFNTAFTLAKATRRLFAAAAAPAAANLIMVAAWVPRYGVAGAMWATVASYGFGLIVSLLLTPRGRALPFPWPTFIKTGAATALMALAVKSTPGFGGVPAIGELATKTMVGVVVFVLGAVFLDAGGLRLTLKQSASDWLTLRKTRIAARSA